MVFQVRKWGWKQLASNLLLIPVLTGGAATVAHAQQMNGAPALGTPAGGTQTAPPTDPKLVLEMGRKALAGGDYNRAKDFAKMAEANNPGGRWGLFEDTPNALLRDVNAAIAKGQRAQADLLYKQAKEFYTKPTASEGDRAANLDKALQLASRANTLRGSYTVWEIQDRPDKLMKEIQEARAHLNVAATPMTAQPAATTPAGAMAGRTDPKKTAAMHLMAEARKMADAGMYGEAKAKLIEAEKLHAVFAETEYSPSWALQELNARGSAAIDRNLAEAKSHMVKKDYPKAEASLAAAADIATALGLYAKPIDDTRSQLRALTKGGSTSPAATASAPDVRLPGAQATTPSPFGPGASSVPLPAASTRPGVPAASAITAKQLLEQADIEFSRGELDMAARLALQAHNLGAQDEARRLLNTIDAERMRLKTIVAAKSLTNAQDAIKARDYNTAMGVLILVEPNLLTSEQKAQRLEMLEACKSALRGPATLAVAGGQTAQPPIAPVAPVVPSMPAPAPGATAPGLTSPPATALPSIPPGSAHVGGDSLAGADNVATQVNALRRAQFQKLRGEGLKIQADAQSAFGRGECDLAIQMLQDYKARVGAANLEPSGTAMLLRPIDSRLEMFHMMRQNQITIARLSQDNKEARDKVRDTYGSADEQRRAEVKKLFEKVRALTKAGDFVGAEKVAVQAKQLDPDNPACTALAEMAKLARAHHDADKLKDDKEKMFRLGLNAAEQEGPLVDADDPVKFQLDRSRLASHRGHGDTSYMRTYTQATYEIELKLNKPISLHFSDTPLDQALNNIRALTDLPIEIDYRALQDEGISPVTPVTVNGGIQNAAKNFLAFTLEQAGLSYVIEHDMVKITTTKKAKGRLYTKVFSVADLVTAVPNFALPDYANFEKMMQVGTGNYGKNLTAFQGSAMPVASPNGLGGGAPASQASMPGVGSGGAGASGGRGGTLQTNPFGSQPSNPLSWSTNLASDNNHHEQLIKLITSMVRPYTWEGVGGPGRLEYYDIGSALVVNQTADVIQEVQDLLEALRRLQDLAIAVELRIVSLSESWFERMGVQFSVNILTNSTKLQPQLTQVDQNTGAAGVFAPIPYLNSLGNVGGVVGLSPAGGQTPGSPPLFTPDLNVPINNSSFQMAVPPFGGYPNTPGADGGVSLGLAFLNEIQVYLFMEAAAGDRRVNVMQAPKLTLFNGQTANIQVNNLQFFVTNVSVISVNGQIVFSPIDSPFPGPGDPFGLNGQNPGQLTVTVQGVVTADRRFVRLNLPITMSAQTGTTVPLFPITTFVTPVFEGGSQGQPIPFTQFLQQPAFTDLTINTTVVCPDGGTVLLGGFKQLSEGRNEFGPPFLSDIPYLNRLFKNVGIGRETTHIMIMVTPRIIINSEEEIRQTEGGGQP